MSKSSNQFVNQVAEAAIQVAEVIVSAIESQFEAGVKAPLGVPLRGQDFDVEMAEIIKASTMNSGVLSKAEIAMYTRKPPHQVRQLIDTAIERHYCEEIFDPKAGKVRYHFDIYP